jgi:hypothetical protein
MARGHGRVNVEIWGDPDWRSLPPQAQHLYLLLWTSPGLTYCGTHDWRPGRLTGLAHGWTADDIRAAADCLAARHFVVIDPDTEEILLRSWVRFDGLLSQPRMAVSCVTAYAAVASDLIRSVLVHELTRAREGDPQWSCWTDARVSRVLAHPAAEPKGWATPEDPFGDGFTPGFGCGLAQTAPSVWVPPTPAPTPAPSPAPEQLPDADASDATNRPTRRRPETALPDAWAPGPKHFAQAEEKGVDLMAEARAFRNHAEAHDRRARNWDAAFRTWLDRARPTTTTNPSPWDINPGAPR